MFKVSDYVFYDGEGQEGAKAYVDRMFDEDGDKERFMETVKKYKLRVK
jgi:hypothetical protein